MRIKQPMLVVEPNNIRLEWLNGDTMSFETVEAAAAFRANKGYYAM